MSRKFQYILIFIGAMMASLGTYPYAKDFSHSIFNNHTLSLLIASIFVPAAVSANMALGVYSLHDSLAQRRTINLTRNVIITIICTIASLSTGFLCFIGYSSQLSLTTNLFLSGAVVVVNIGIGFSAMNNAINDLNDIKRTNNLKSIKIAIKRRPIKIILGIITVLCALFVTLTAYLASTHGLQLALENLNKFSSVSIENISYLIAIIIWLPGAVLFANGSRITVLKIYDALCRGKLRFSYITYFIMIIAIASGSAYAGMALEFFDSSKDIPNLFRKISNHYNFVFYGIAPLAFFISAVVNGYALENLWKETSKRYNRSFKNQAQRHHL